MNLTLVGLLLVVAITALILMIVRHVFVQNGSNPGDPGQPL
jgi:hypothetical protein